MDERQHYSNSQIPNEGTAEALQMFTLSYRELCDSLSWILNETRPDKKKNVILAKNANDKT
jgi:hypothetical protein